MTSATEKKTVPHALLEVELRMYVPVPLEAFRPYGGEGELTEDVLEGMRGDELRDIFMEDTDRLHDAITDQLEQMDDFIDVSFDAIEDREVPGKVELYKPDGYYTLPVPNLISGNVIFTDEGIEPVEVSNVNNLTDDQLEGAYYAAKRIWGLRGMHRYQKVQLAEFLGELQWAMLARPSRHVFKAGDETNGDLFDPALCSYCGNEEAGHLVREGDTSAGE